MESRKTYLQIETETKERRRSQAEAALRVVEDELVYAVEQAELDMAKAEGSLRRVLDLSRRRYALKHDASGKAVKSLLAKAPMAGWLQWRLLDLELPDLGRPPHHYRAPLAELLGLNYHDNGDQARRHKSEVSESLEEPSAEGQS